jgi:hypothetical protein
MSVLMMNPSRLAGVLIGAGLIVAGCLFPSFDGLEGGKGEGEGDGDSDGSSSSGSNSSSGSSGSSSSSGDGGSPTPSGPSIHCHDGEGGVCPIPSQFCCSTVGGPVCYEVAGISGPQNCAIQGLGTGKSFLCDGKEDCADNEVCCFNDQSDSNGVNARCTLASNCTVPNKAVCNGPKRECPDTSRCEGLVSNTNIKVCER